ncbi:MAG: 2Fe-2S iron-sulfur cluster-binding protein [Kovacikia sp.]
MKAGLKSNEKITCEHPLNSGKHPHGSAQLFGERSVEPRSLKIQSLKSFSNRLPPIPGEWIDRSQRIDFTFEGNPFQGYAGDRITSALIASGQRVLGRSFKYHRPRRILSFANQDVNALMQDGQQLNIRADVFMRQNPIRQLIGFVPP